MTKLRLLVTTKCNRNCSKCCNKSYDLSSLPVVSHFNYEEIIITGGEPLLDTELTKTIQVLRYLRNTPNKVLKRVFLYTASINNVSFVLSLVDGVTLTIHTDQDAKTFKVFNSVLLRREYLHTKKSLRLKIMEGVKFDFNQDLHLWQVKDNCKWLDSCPLPEDEVFMRLPSVTT